MLLIARRRSFCINYINQLAERIIKTEFKSVFISTKVARRRNFPNRSGDIIPASAGGKIRSIWESRFPPCTLFIPYPSCPFRWLSYARGIESSRSWIEPEATSLSALLELSFGSFAARVLREEIHSFILSSLLHVRYTSFFIDCSSRNVCFSSGFFLSFYPVAPFTFHCIKSLLLVSPIVIRRKTSS